MKTIDIKGKPYIEVNERLKEFRSNPKYDGYSLESEFVVLDDGICTIKAIIKNAQGVVIATGLAQEKESSSFINKTSYIENCETSAWGRALGNLGIGIDTSIASADEVLNAIKNQETKKVDLQDDYNVELDIEIAKEENKLICSKCSAQITNAEYSYSNIKYGAPLCRRCQANFKKLA